MNLFSYSMNNVGAISDCGF